MDSPYHLGQDDLEINGHSLELRIYAEDPDDNFLPSIGRLEQYESPHGQGIRVDEGYRQGMDIPIYYDPMIAKLVTHAPTRVEAIELMKKAISSYKNRRNQNDFAIWFICLQS